ncbi:MAG: hypothetical protein CMN32_09675 [Saprospirales bacterium]|nr:hypothetical protein [Saprospirales bacterium]
MLNKYLTLTCLLCFSFFISFGQNKLVIGQWKEHLPFKSGISVTQSDSKVYYGTPYALLIIDKADHSIQKVTKVEGLSQVGVNLVKYNRQSKVLVIVYENSVIDLVKEGGIFTLLNLPESNIILGEKKVYDVFMANDSIAYLAANYGISTLNLNSGLFPNTTKTPVEVHSVHIYDGKVYAATDEGLYTFDLSAGLNIDDFSNWELLVGEQGFPFDYSANALATFNGKLYMGVSDSIYVYDGSQASYVTHMDGLVLSYLSAEGAHLLAGYDCTGEGCSNGRALIIDEAHNIQTIGGLCTNRPRYAIEDQNGVIWYADRFNGYRWLPAGESNCQIITVNSPRTHHVREMDFRNGQLWIATGGLNVQYSALFRTDGFLSLIDGQWNEYNIWNKPALAEDPISDFLDIIVHPETGKIYAAAFYDALVVYDPFTDQFEIYRENNSTLQLAEGDPTRSRVSSIAFDAEGNLWVANNNAPRPLSVLKTDGSWQSFDLPCTPEDGVLNLAIDDFGYKWLTTTNSSLGLIVFDEGAFDEDSDDRCVVVNTSNSVLPTNEVNTIERDLDGAMWVGTKLGAVVFQCNPLDSECPGTQPFVEVDGFGANLLEDQDVRTIGVDGGNRKWFGTGTGLFLMSPAGNEQIAKYTVDNSPLFDNNITDVAFDHESGEVFIGTQKGLISLRGEATEGEAFHQNKVLVFPNPVRPGYEGPIAIKGLAEDSTVKITDINGQLVYETEALGGQAIWNGRDYNNRKVTSGVYLVYATNRNIANPSVAVAKIMIVR